MVGDHPCKIFKKSRVSSTGQKNGKNSNPYPKTTFQSIFTHLKLNMNSKNNEINSHLTKRTRNYFEKTEKMLQMDNKLKAYNDLNQNEKIKNTRQEIASLLNIAPESKMKKNQSSTFSTIGISHIPNSNASYKDSISINNRIKNLQNELNKMNIAKSKYTHSNNNTLLNHKKSINKIRLGYNLNHIPSYDVFNKKTKTISPRKNTNSINDYLYHISQRNMSHNCSSGSFKNKSKRRTLTNYKL